MRALGATLLLTGCGLVSATAPAGLVCDRLQVASADLAESLAAAKAKDCVIVTAGTYTGHFVLPVDVSLAASQGSKVTLKGDGSGEPVLTVRGGKRSTVSGIKVDSSEGTGIAIDPGPVNLIAVVVAGNSTHDALTSTCLSGPCEEVSLEDCELTKSTTGLLAAGGMVRMKRGRVAENSGTGLSDGDGVVASRGASLTLDGVVVENNSQIGVLVDGPATRVELIDATVRGNLERGVWIQNLSSDAGVSITGSEISANRLVGIGIRDSAGVTLTRTAVRDTTTVEVPVGISGKEMVGDGVGLFSGARDVVLDTVTATGNGRAQILADACGTGVHVTSPTLSGGQFRVVVQRGSSALDVSPSLVDDPGRELATKSSTVPVSQ